MHTCIAGASFVLRPELVAPSLLAFASAQSAPSASAWSVDRIGLVAIWVIAGAIFILSLIVQGDDRKRVEQVATDLKQHAKDVRRLADVVVRYVQRVDWLSLELDAMAQRWPFAAVCSDPVIVEALLSAPFGIISISTDSTALPDCAALARRVQDRARDEG